MDVSTPEGKGMPWTDEAKYQLLLRIVAQLRADGRSINWNKINMPGRTIKSLQNMWTKINKNIAEFEQEAENGPPTRTASRKRGPSKVKTDNDDEVAEALGSLLKKRRVSKNAGSGAQKRKGGSSDEDEIDLKGEVKSEDENS